MRHNYFFEFARIDVVAAAQDHIFFAVNDRKIAVVVENADVAGVKPAVFKCFGGCFGAFVITFHHVRAANDDFAAFAGCDFVVVFVNAFYFDTEDRLTDRAGF